MKLEERLYFGDQAKIVLENESFIEAFASIEKDLTQSWANLPSTEQTRTERDRIHLALTLLGKVRSSLVTTMETGKLAKVELERLNLMQRAKKALLQTS